MSSKGEGRTVGSSGANPPSDDDAKRLSLIGGQSELGTADLGSHGGESGALQRVVMVVMQFFGSAPIAVLFGVISPLLLFAYFGHIFATVGGARVAVGEWLSFSGQPELVAQQLLVALAAASVISLKVLKLRPVFLVWPLAISAASASVIGLCLAPLFIVLSAIDYTRILALFPYVAPWLAAASYGACAIEAREGTGGPRLSAAAWGLSIVLFISAVVTCVAFMRFAAAILSIGV